MLKLLHSCARLVADDNTRAFCLHATYNTERQQAVTHVLTGPVWDKVLDRSLVTSRSSRVREQLFDLLLAAWMRKPALHPRLQPYLLAFLADASAALRGRALEFWHRELPKDVPGRLRALLLDGAAATAATVRVNGSARYRCPRRRRNSAA